MNPLPSYFETFEHEAFRVESLPRYKIESNGEYEQFCSYLEGEMMPDVTINSDWYASIRKWIKEGKDILRIRVLPTKHDPYIDFEIEWFYPHNVQAGEIIQVISESDFREITDIPLHDFWIFDSKNVGVMKYSKDGEFMDGALPELPTSEYIRLKSLLLDKSTPLKQYLAAKRNH